MKTPHWHCSCPIHSYVLFALVSVLIGTMTSNSRAADPISVGQLANDWDVGELLYEDNFDNPDKWEIQIEASDSSLVPEVTFENGVLDMYIPSRGATAWLKEKFDGPVLVVYDVLTPEGTLSGNDIRVGDVNTFLHASDPVVEDRIFDDTLYTGQFGTYGKMNGYYASSGGGQNTTTRLRRYPRSDLDGNDISHLVMNGKDGQGEYLLTAGQKHSIQLASVGGHVQYVFDGQIVYEIEEDDVVFREDPGGVLSREIYDFENYPEHTSGYFGFRMLRAHHQYSALKVYELKRVERTDVSVSSLAELREVVTQNNQHIVLTPGDYNIEELPRNLRYFVCSGSNNIIDLTGVYIDFPVGSGSSGQEYFLVIGSDNTIRGGVFENTYTNGIEDVTDFVAYNKDRNNLAYGAGPHIVIQGDGNSVVGTKLTVRGSFPYGYGSIYGIGAQNVFGLDKRAGIAVQGTNVVIDSCELQMRAFGHGIYIQSPSNNTVVRNTLVEGAVRSGADMLADDDSGSLPSLSDFLNFSNDFDNPEPIDPTDVHSLCEDGIRVYSGGGSVIVENCTVTKMRGGIRLYLASEATVINSTAIDNGNVNWNMPNNGTVVNSSGNFAYAPLSDFRLSRSNMDIEWTIIPSPHAVGPHNLCDVLGNGHTIVF
ncbi:DUF6250 domain-containing protein, partial [Puniceicoccaceae bacterium K14]|nr:DUF6250 domain-containing protein [Puniceicoccaceae bacterium K14]